MKNSFPDWVLRHKRAKTEIRCIKGRYYLYEVSSKWDRKLKRSKKITGAYLGSITREGFKPKRNTSDVLANQSVRVLNAGAIAYLQNRNQDIIKALEHV